MLFKTLSQRPNYSKSFNSRNISQQEKCLKGSQPEKVFLWEKGLSAGEMFLTRKSISTTENFWISTREKSLNWEKVSKQEKSQKKSSKKKYLKGRKVFQRQKVSWQEKSFLAGKNLLTGEVSQQKKNLSVINFSLRKSLSNIEKWLNGRKAFEWEESFHWWKVS